MKSENIAIPLKRFLLVQQCPASWKGLDLYLFRDENVVFYVGQSYLAFARVWEHLLGGFKGHSTVGRFVWCNWPTSMNFTIELLSSQYIAQPSGNTFANFLFTAKCPIQTQARLKYVNPRCRAGSESGRYETLVGKYGVVKTPLARSEQIIKL